MTRKGFETIARIIAVIPSTLDRALATEKAIELCGADNPRFDAQRFRDAITKARQIKA